MSALVRTAVGVFTLDRAAEFSAITAERLPELIEDPLVAFEGWPRFTLDSAELPRVAQGPDDSPLAAPKRPAIAQRDEVLALDPSRPGWWRFCETASGTASDQWHPRLTFFAGS